MSKKTSFRVTATCGGVVITPSTRFTCGNPHDSFVPSQIMDLVKGLNILRGLNPAVQFVVAAGGDDSIVNPGVSTLHVWCKAKVGQPIVVPI